MVFSLCLMDISQQNIQSFLIICGLKTGILLEIDLPHGINHILTKLVDNPHDFRNGPLNNIHKLMKFIDRLFFVLPDLEIIILR